MSKKSRKCITTAAIITAMLCPQSMVQASEEMEVNAMDTAVIYSEDNYTNEFVPGHVLVAVEKDTKMKAADSLFDRLAVTKCEKLNPVDDQLSAQGVQEDVWLLTIEGEQRSDVLEAIQVLKDHPEVIYAEPDYIVHADATVPNDPGYSNQYGLTKISAPKAWDTFTGSSSVVVGIIDSGIDYTHPDLAGNMWRNPGEIANDGIDNDGNGYIDDVYGWDFVDNDNTPMDENGHGTHCAGVTAAIGNNSQGIAGVSWNAKLAALRFLDEEGGGNVSDAVKAINYATVMGIPITNNSWGGGGYSQTLYNAIKKTGLFVAASGNEGRNISYRASYPASFNLSNIISVAAVDSNDRLASFSNYSSSAVDLAAPGVNIYSCLPGNQYGNLSGTSMATPFVTGAAALLLGYNPSYTKTQLANKILSSVDYVSRLSGKVSTGGRLNISKFFSGSTTRNGVDYGSVYDYDYYIAHNPDVAAAYGDNKEAVLAHFVDYGMKEGRTGNEEFKLAYYKKNYEDLRNAFGDDNISYYQHYMQYGREEGRNAQERIIPAVTTYQGIDYSAVYDYEYYINAYSDLKEAFGDDEEAAIRHFVEYGMAEGRQACEEFNVQKYQANYDDLAAAYGDNLPMYYQHYMTYGVNEGRTAK